MVPRIALPPTHPHPHLTKSLSPSDAEQALSTFLDKTQHQPWLHPDSYLSTTGVTFSATSGPIGGLAIHHLRRIAAGLRGENLAQETKEELDQKFGAHDQIAEGDDARLDALIEKSEERRGRKRKRIEVWAEDTSSQMGEVGPQEIESFANTPMHNPDLDNEWRDKAEWEQEQDILEGEVGEREGAPVVKQNGHVPEVVEHDDHGNVKGISKEARKAAKKARRLEEKREKAALLGSQVKGKG
jgi:hypothetical protein